MKNWHEVLIFLTKVPVCVFLPEFFAKLGKKTIICKFFGKKFGGSKKFAYICTDEETYRLKG